MLKSSDVRVRVGITSPPARSASSGNPSDTNQLTLSCWFRLRSKYLDGYLINGLCEDDFELHFRKKKKDIVEHKLYQ